MHMGSPHLNINIYLFTYFYSAFLTFWAFKVASMSVFFKLCHILSDIKSPIIRFPQNCYCCVLQGGAVTEVFSGWWDKISLHSIQDVLRHAIVKQLTQVYLETKAVGSSLRWRLRFGGCCCCQTHLFPGPDSYPPILLPPHCSLSHPVLSHPTSSHLLYQLTFLNRSNRIRQCAWEASSLPAGALEMCNSTNCFTTAIRQSVLMERLFHQH